MNQLKILINDEIPVAVILSETHIASDINDSEIKIKGYNILRCEVYVKKNVMFKVLKNNCIDKELWLLGIALKFENVLYNVYGVYNPNTSNFYRIFCESEIDFSKINVIVGDINIDLLNDYYYSKKLKECINDSTLKQIVTKPTRITKHSRTLIDHVMINDVSVVKYEILNDQLISDRSTIKIVIKKSVKSKGKNSIEIVKYETSDLSNFFSNNKCDSSISDGVNQKSNHFMSVIKKIL